MNGPEHYREAEQLLVTAARVFADADSEGADFFTRRAQVHATLANAAAAIEDMESSELRPGWAAIVDEGSDAP